MAQNNSLISIIIPTYNRSDLIIETLNSVLSQTYQDWECIVVDDGSTDDSETIVKAYCDKYSRFSYFNRPNHKPKGANACRNFGMENCKGDFVIFLDSDDLLLPFALEQRMQTMLLKNCDMVVTHSVAFEQVIGDLKTIWNKIETNDSTQDLLIRFFKSDMPWCTHSVLWTRTLLEKIEGWDETLNAWQDWDIHCRALLEHPNIAIVKGKPDNYFRHSNHDSIGSLYRSKVYFESLCRLIVSTDKSLRQKGKHTELTLKHFKAFVLSKGIEKPLSKGFNFMPLRLLCRARFIKGMNRFYFFKVYGIQLLGKSYKLRKFIINRIFKRQQNLFVIDSTHLKLTIDDL